jgi:hypothetical protein
MPRFTCLPFDGPLTRYRTIRQISRMTAFVLAASLIIGPELSEPRQRSFVSL